MNETIGNRITKFRKEKIDILIGNHPKNVDTAGKYQRIVNGETDAFIDPTQLDRWLDEVQRTYDEMIASGSICSTDFPVQILSLISLEEKEHNGVINGKIPFAS